MYKSYLYVMYKQKRETKKHILREQMENKKNVDEISHCLSLFFLFVQTEACEKGFRSNSFFQA